MRGVLVSALGLVAAVAVAAAEPPARVVEVATGDTIRLEHAVVRLAGIEAPKPAPVAEGGASRLADAARALLAALVAGRAVDAVAGPEPLDRHGRVLAHVVRDDGLWVQGEMLRQGLARVRTSAGDRERAAEMLAIEAEARAAGRGIWSTAAFAVRTPDEAARHLGGFEVVEGTVVDAANVRGTVYLNFGPDWRTDFTVRVRPAARRTFEAAGIDLVALAGRRVRVRGWLDRLGGPMIDATHPEQLEVLDGGE